MSAVRRRPRRGAPPSGTRRPRGVAGVSPLNAGGERWFLALWPDQQVRDCLALGSRRLIPSGARGTHPQDLHLTLRFLGPLGPEDLTRAEGAAESVAGLPPVPLCIDRLGHFPRSRVLWAGPSVPGAGLLRLGARLEESLSAHGFSPEARPFRVHMTLARKVRRPPPLVWGDPCPWLARELVLAAGQEGLVPRYRVRRSWSLGGTLSGPLDEPLNRQLLCAEAAPGPGHLLSRV